MLPDTMWHKYIEVSRKYKTELCKHGPKFPNPKCLRMSQHHLGLHNIQLVFDFCLYIPCDTKCRTFFRMALKDKFWCYKRRIPAFCLCYVDLKLLKQTSKLLQFNLIQDIRCLELIWKWILFSEMQRICKSMILSDIYLTLLVIFKRNLILPRCFTIDIFCENS